MACLSERAICMSDPSDGMRVLGETLYFGSQTIHKNDTLSCLNEQDF